ncbi:MAG: hypothetical protein ACUVUG_05060 [Candidatus Aminicenantia bacterium]
MRSKGYTTIELLIIIGILGLLVGLFYIGYSGSRKRIDIDNVSNSIVTSLIDLRLKSMTTDNLHGFMTSQGCQPGNDCYATFIFKDENNNYIIDGNEKQNIHHFNFPPYISFDYSSSNPITIFFDKRGLPRDENGNFTEKIIKLVMQSGGKKLEREILISMRIVIKKL